MPFLLNVMVAVGALGAMPFFKKAAIAGGLAPLSLAVAAGVAAALTAVVLTRPHGLLQPPFPRRLWAVAVIGVLASGVVILLNAFALSFTTATNRSLFQALYPAATALFAWLLLRERVRASDGLLIAAVTGGVVLMNAAGAGLTNNPGFWLLAATLPLVGFSDAYAKRTLGGVPPGPLATGRFAFGALFLLLAAPVAGDGLAGASAAAWGWGLLGGACAALGILAFYRAMGARPAGVVSALVATAPLLTAVLEAAFLHQRFTPLELAGGVLAVSAAALLALRS